MSGSKKVRRSSVPPSPQPKVTPEPVPQWITREEARELLGVADVELRELTRGWNLSERLIPVYLKAEVLALAGSVAKVR